MRTGGRTLRATWVPPKSRQYRRSGGPWDGPNLDQLLAAAGGELVDGGRRLSPSAIDALVARVAGGLLERGAGPRRSVAWQLPNCLASVVLYRACWRIGAVAAPILHTLGPADRSAALEQIEPTVTVELSADAPSAPDALVTQIGGPPVASGTYRTPGSAVAVVLFTSGSTGVPKAVLHTHRGLSWKARLMTQVHGLGADDAVLMPAPLAHVSGLLNGVLLPGAAGMRSVLMRRFDPEQALVLVGKERVSFLAGPPTFFVAMAEGVRRELPSPGSPGSPGSPAVDVSSLRLVSSGGAAVTPAFVESTAATFGCRVKRTYGSTEAPTVTTSMAGDPVEAARDTDGRPVGQVELRIVEVDQAQEQDWGGERGEGAAGNGAVTADGGDDLASLSNAAPGEIGELWVRGPELFAGYAVASQNTAVCAPGGWFRTGDLATVDEDGWLRISGRLKDVIIRGGENISASEVEGLLEAHPAVNQAVVVGFPDPRLGEKVAAFVVISGAGAGAAPFDLDLCRRWFERQGVARFKTPEVVVTVERLPLLGTGKPDRAALSARAREQASR